MFAFHRDQFDRERVVSSPFVSTRTLFFIRAIPSFYMLAVNMEGLIFHIRRGSMQFFYAFFTVLSYVGLTSYMVTATVHTGVAAFAANRYYLFDALPRFLSDILFWLLYETAIPYSFIVTLVYWSVLYQPKDQPNALATWFNVSVHALNFAIALVEMIFNRMIMKRSHVLYFCIPAALYLCLAWTLYGAYGVFTYPFLDFVHHHGAVAGVVVGLMAGFVLVFMLFTFIHDIKDKLTNARYEAKCHSNPNNSFRQMPRHT
ncbi:hypothetical protein GQ42DRAFT_127889 [Ramicandelaber brevisporus]|nr:hypothetical protein GQ42DRAFT_127889 [Ramicandelaber brevisporus]